MDEQVRAATAAFREAFGGDPDADAAAPGRTNLIGGHTDYEDGFVLPVAIDRWIAVAARRRSDDVLRVHSRNYGETDAVDLGAIERVDAPAWSNYARGVAATLQDAGVDVPGAEVAISGGVPQGAGLASSAALEVAVADALADLAGVDLEPGELASLCRRAETEFVGVGCGVMDQLAAVSCRAGHAMFLDCRTKACEHYPLDPSRASVLVTDTNVTHSLVDSAYNRRREACRRGVETLDARIDRPIDALRDVTRADLAAHGDALEAVVERRCRHVVGENDRVQSAAAALSAGDLERVGELMSASHRSLREDYQVSCAELDAVAGVADDQPGVFGSRMTGAGFGGCVVSLVEPDAVEAVERAIREGYREETGEEADVYVCEPVAGCRPVGAAAD